LIYKAILTEQPQSNDGGDHQHAGYGLQPVHRKRRMSGGFSPRGNAIPVQQIQTPAHHFGLSTKKLKAGS
jgi:hypothetical protein